MGMGGITSDGTPIWPCLQLGAEVPATPLWKVSGGIEAGWGCSEPYDALSLKGFIGLEFGPNFTGTYKASRAELTVQASLVFAGQISGTIGTQEVECPRRLEDVQQVRALDFPANVSLETNVSNPKRSERRLWWWNSGDDAHQRKSALMRSSLLEQKLVLRALLRPPSACGGKITQPSLRLL